MCAGSLIYNKNITLSLLIGDLDLLNAIELSQKTQLIYSQHKNVINSGSLIILTDLTG